MLDLNSSRWNELRHAYGPAGDVPAMLRQLADAVDKAGYRVGPWFSLWSALCHQSDVYTASYAALPHIVSSAKDRPAGDRAGHLVLAASIEAMRHRSQSPAIPEDLESAYRLALSEGASLTLGSLAEEEDQPWFRGLLGALAAFRGFPKLSAAVTELGEDIECPKCGAWFKAPGYDFFL